jgi:D-alanyl-D-alanine dipeptidase
MKFNLIYLTLILISFKTHAQLPEGFVYVTNEIPSIKTELRYFSENNFVGSIIDGYKANTTILTKEATIALKNVQEQLLKKNLSLKIYDAYRPQKAVNYFWKWSKNLNDTLMKQQYYPNLKKHDIFTRQFIAKYSRHSSGSTVDVTIVDNVTGKELDMGTPYDFFGEESSINFKGINETQQKNRMLLLQIMLRNEFRNYPKEWWHYTLKNEPFKNHYFNFDVK